MIFWVVAPCRILHTAKILQSATTQKTNIHICKYLKSHIYRRALHWHDFSWKGENYANKWSRCFPFVNVKEKKQNSCSPNAKYNRLLPQTTTQGTNTHLTWHKGTSKVYQMVAYLVFQESRETPLDLLTKTDTVSLDFDRNNLICSTEK